VPKRYSRAIAPDTFEPTVVRWPYRRFNAVSIKDPVDVSDRTAAAQTWRGGPGAAAIEEEEREPDVGRIEQAGAALCVAATLVTEGPVAAGATRNTVSDLRRGEARQVSDAGGLLRHWRREVWRLATASRRSVIQWMSPGRSWRVLPSSRKCRAISCRPISRPTPRRDRVCSPPSAGWECGRRWLARATRRSTRIRGRGSPGRISPSPCSERAGSAWPS